MSSNVSGCDIERSDENWNYVLDACRAPLYVTFTLGGVPDARTVELVAMDLVELMDPVVGSGMTFCPIIADVRKVQSGKMGASTLTWASGRALGRMGRILLIFDPDTLTRAQYASFIKLSIAAIPQIEVVYSFEEALERLGL
jgi:hypothetical protein